ncbi:MAG: hypothetical protein ABFE07_07770 [Armatimonadia bacterium]
MSRVSRAALVMGCAALILTMVPAMAQGGARQKGGERRGGGMRSMGFVEQSWAALCFEVNISQAQITKLKPSYQWAWKTRNAAMKSAMAKRDFESLGKTMTSVRSSLETKIKSVLTKQQLAQWNKWQAEQAKRMMRGGPGGGKKK